MERAVRRVAPQLRRDFGEVEQLQVSTKGPADFVSQADYRAEAMLREELNRVRPEWGFLLEESGQVAGDPGAPRWIVDPLDGTSNFLHGIPHFAVSVAVEQDGEIIAGIVYNPITDETFWAEKGKGAWCGDRRLRVSGRRELAHALLATGIPFKGHGDQVEFGRILAAVAPQVAGIRRFGAAALDLAWVAAGRFDGYFERDIQAWDIAAGLLLVREAGGLITDYRGEQTMLESGQVIAANPALYTMLHKLIAQAVRA